MKYILAASLLVISSLAHATYCSDGSLIASHPNGNCSVPVPSTSTPSTAKSDADANAAAKAAAAAGAVSGSRSAATGGRSTSSATGGAGGSGTGGDASNSLGSVGNDNSQSSFKALAISLPSPVFVPPMPAIGDCPSATVTQSSRAVGWNFVSWADSKIDTDNCTTIKIYGSLMQRCKYKSASLVLAHLTVKVLPEYRPEEDADIDLTDRECRELSLPVQAPVQVSPINFVSAIPAACVPVAAPRKGAVKRKPAAVCK